MTQKRRYLKASQKLRSGLKLAERLTDFTHTSQGNNERKISPLEIVEAKSVLAQALISLDNYKQATDVLEGAKRDLNYLLISEEFEVALSILTNLVTCYLAVGQSERAKKNLLLSEELIQEYKLTKQENTHIFILSKLAELSEGERDYQNAIVWLTKLTRIYSKNSREYFLSTFKIGKILSESGDSRQALVWLKTASEAEGKCQQEDSEIKLEIARCMKRSGSLEGQIEAFHSVVRSGSSEQIDEALLQLLSLYLQKSKVWEARETVHKLEERASIDLKPRSLALLNEIGNIYRNNRKNYEAIEYYKKALMVGKQLHRSNSTLTLPIGKVVLNIGAVYFLQRRYEEALRYYTHGLQLYKKLMGAKHLEVGRIHRNIGKLLERENRREEANIHYGLADEIFLKQRGESSSKQW